MNSLRALLAFYATQLHLLRQWSGGRAALLRRGMETFAVAVTSLVATSWLVRGIAIHDPPRAAASALLLAGISTLSRPLLITLFSGISVALAGAVTFSVQIFGFWLLSLLPSGIEIDGLRSVVFGALVYSLAETVVVAGLSLGDDNAFFGTLVRQLAARHRGAVREDEPGVVFVQIDGLSHPLLLRSIEEGRLPTLARWLRDGAMTLDEWEPLVPSQTSAIQAGLLHGNNDGIPGFRWWDKETGRLLVSNHPSDAREIERRVSDGRGLLATGGASIGNLLSGDAPRSFLTAATIRNAGGELGRSHVLDWFFISPYSYVRWLMISAGEIVKEIAQANRERVAGISPRGSRGFPYPLARAGTTVLLRHLTTALVIEEIYRGSSPIYVDMVDYDEIAHHSGVARIEALDTLGGIDRMIGLIEKAALDAPRRYRFVVLSDHGQSPGATFRQRYGRTLDELLVELLGHETSIHAATEHVEHWGRMNVLASETTGLGGVLARALRGGAHEERPGGALPDVVVAASGNLAHVSFAKIRGRATKSAIDAAHPGLVERLVGHPGVGLLMLREHDGATVLGRGGVRYLRDDRIEGGDPLEGLAPHAAEGLRRLDAMPNCGDLVIISAPDDATGEVASFEHQIGSHGGLGGPQTQAFVLHPSEWNLDGEIVGATELHRGFRAWLRSS